MSVRPIAAGRVERRPAGRELSAMTGMSWVYRLAETPIFIEVSIAREVEGMLRTHRETHVACAKKAPMNLGGEVRILSKRESVPLSAVIREKRNVPTVRDRKN